MGATLWGPVLRPFAGVGRHEASKGTPPPGAGVVWFGGAGMRPRGVAVELVLGALVLGALVLGSLVWVTRLGLARAATEEVGLQPSATLRQLGDAAGLEVGAAVAWEPLRNDSAYAALAGSQFHVLTPENALKWAPIEHTAGMRDLSRADELLAFAQAHDQQLRGHALVWDLEIPSWVEVSDKQMLVTAQQAHLDRTVRAYAGRIPVWDVVNEALDERGQLKSTPLMRHVGAGYIAEAFHAAHRADPAARLFYNEHAVLWPGLKADGLDRLVDQLLAAKVPIHGVGLQSHLDLVPDGPLDWDGIEAHIQALGARGVTVHLTEIDVRVAQLDGSQQGRWLAQAQALHRLVDICRRQPACTRITFWGIGDRYSWVDRDIGPDDPLPWDDDLRQKPALAAVREALQAKPWSVCGQPQIAHGDLEADNAVIGATCDSCQVARSQAAARGPGLGLRVSERTDTWQGPQVHLTDVVSEGLSWRLGSHVRVREGAPLKLTLRIVDGAGTRYVSLSETVGTGAWQELSAVHRFSLTAPIHSVSLYVEGPPAGVDIDLDDLTVQVRCQGASSTG